MVARQRNATSLLLGLAARFDALRPAVRLTVATLLSLALWGAILLGLGELVGDAQR